MKLELSHFSLFPKFIPAGSDAQIRIRPLFDNVRFPGISQIKVQVFEADSGPRGPDLCRAAEMTGGVLVIRAAFGREGQYNIRVSLAEVPGWAETLPWAKTDSREFHFSVYALDTDLFRLHPFKGELHCHSVFSDGTESPAYVAADYRRAGFDFMALTDHSKYQPSLDAVEYWKNLHNGFKLYPGEEVHLPCCGYVEHLYQHVHVVNFGGRASVNGYAYANEARFLSEVKARMPEFDGLSEADRFVAASAEWAFDKVREYGGFCTLAHPYWQQNDTNVVPETVITALLDRCKFDALEVYGGFTKPVWRGNCLQAARYHQELARGKRIPVVGASDSHGYRQDSGGCFCTVVLAGANTLGALSEAVRQGNCVAIHSFENEIPHLAGDFRLVKFVSFLLDEYFPLHERICRIEGELMLSALAGDDNSKTLLEIRGAPAEEFRDNCYRAD